MLRTLRLFATCISMLAGSMALISTASAQTANSRKIVYAAYLSDAFTLVKLDKWYMDEVAKRTNGAVTFEPYYSGSLLKASDILPGVASGAADMGNTVPSAFNRKDYPLSNITLPFISDQIDTVTKAFKELYETNPQFRAEYEKRGLKLLFAPAPAENTIWSQKPISNAGDVRGLKIRAVLAVGDALNAMGAAVLAMPFPDAVEGLQRGTVEAISTAPFDTAIAGGLHEISAYGSDLGGLGIYAVSATVISLKTWNSLPKNVQTTMEQVAAEVPAYYIGMMNEAVDVAAKKVVDRVKSGKLKVNLFDTAARTDVRSKVAADIEKAWIQTANASGADGKAVLDQYKALIAKHASTSAYQTGFDRYRKLMAQ